MTAIIEFFLGVSPDPSDPSQVVAYNLYKMISYIIGVLFLLVVLDLFRVIRGLIR